jgi:aspartate/methionine/tyrosine aminotransferase
MARAARLYPQRASTALWAEEGIYACMRALLVPGDHVVVVTPAYQSLVSIAQAAVRSDERGGVGISLVDLEVRQGRWVLPIEQLRASIRPESKMVVVNFPHNPTGALLTGAEQLEVVELCRKHDLYLFSDEVYRGLERDPAERLPPACTLYAKAFSLGVMSRSAWRGCASAGSLPRTQMRCSE